jgi:hypothetical protein
MNEAIQTLRTPRQLRFLFIHLLTNDCFSSPLEAWDSFKMNLCHNFLLRYNNDIDIASMHCLQQLSKDLEEHGRTLSHYGLPEPELHNDEIEHELMRWNQITPQLQRSTEDGYRQLNSEQRAIYDTIIDCIINRKPLCLFVDGKAGRGKTFLINTVCDRVRSLRKIVLPTATSAFAAQLYPGGRTTHSTFKVQNNAASCHLLVVFTLFEQKDSSQRQKRVIGIPNSSRRSTR